MKPRDVKKYQDIVKMKRDNWSYGNYTIGFNSEKELYLLDQKLGEQPIQNFLIPFKVLKFFIKKFNEDSK